ATPLGGLRERPKIRYAHLGAQNNKKATRKCRKKVTTLNQDWTKSTKSRAGAQHFQGFPIFYLNIFT
ncbi:MAG: hypothetical protein PHO37_16865, partial [Kiritimatiellae bacterium]|nr:hypothetical protein [Kiritimatiellia bacterium]